jgi:hypothetical protein
MHNFTKKTAIAADNCVRNIKLLGSYLIEKYNIFSGL